MNSQQTSTMVSSFDGYFYQTLHNATGRHIVLQTTKNPLQGMLKKTMPDHLVVEVNGTPFYVRIQEIVWAMVG